MSIMPEVGKLFDARYQILKKIAQGGMGAVYQAVDQRTNQVVAIKLILPYKAEDKDALQRFRKEAEALKRLQHPHIVKFHRFIVRTNFTYLVLDYLTGQTLQEKLEGGYRFSVAEATRIVQQVAEALNYAHQNGIVHRDVKPSNIMLSEQGQAILMDFGIVKIEGTAPLTATGTMIGSVAYVSPEQAKGDRLDYRTDIYSLGTVLYQLLTGHMPFFGQNEAVVLIKILNESPPAMRQFVPDLPKALIDIVAKAMHKDKMHRYESAAAFVQALSHLDIDPVTIRPVPLHPKTPIPTVPSAFWHQPSIRWLFTAIISFVIVTGFVVLFILVWIFPISSRESHTPVTISTLAITTTSTINQISSTLTTMTIPPLVNGSNEATATEMPDNTPHPLTITPTPSEPTLIPTYTYTPAPTTRLITITATATVASFAPPPDEPTETHTLAPVLLSPTSTSVPPTEVPTSKPTEFPTPTPPPIFDTPTPEPGSDKSLSNLKP